MGGSAPASGGPAPIIVPIPASMPGPVILPIPNAPAPVSGVPVPANMPSIVDGNGVETKGYNYVGCFQDSVSRTLLGSSAVDYLSGSMSTMICANHCFERGYTFAGTESGNECWCGETIRTDAVRLPESYCQTPCNGKQDSVCGGRWAISIFSDPNESLQTITPHW